MTCDSSSSTIVQLSLFNINGASGPLADVFDVFTNMTILTIRQVQANGTFPPSLATLTQLTSFVIATTLNSGPIPSSWSNLRSLNVFKIQNMVNLNGTVPDIFVNMTNLQQVIISLYQSSLSNTSTLLNFKFIIVNFAHHQILYRSRHFPLIFDAEVFDVPSDSVRQYYRASTDFVSLGY